MAMPLPLQIHGSSGLSFPWAFEQRFNLSMGGDGVAWSEVMQINWRDLETAMKELLGYSWRDTSVNRYGNLRLRRSLPWQHPYWNQMWVKGVRDFEGIRLMGTGTADVEFYLPGGGPGDGTPLNLGPWTNYDRVRFTVQFWRPNYYVRSDESIQDADGFQQEWLRYVEKDWSENIQILNREGSQFVWSGGWTGNLPGTVGQAVTHQKVTRTWYEVPEAGLFQTSQDSTPNGQADNLLYSTLQVVNPLTGYVYATGYPLPMSVNVPIGGGIIGPLTCNTTSGLTTVTTATTAALNVGDFVTGAGIKTNTSILTVDSGTQFTMTRTATATAAASLTFVSDYDSADRLFGCHMGTLRFDFAELRPRPLQLPPYLMQIPTFSGNQPISQQQYDVMMHFDIFDPPRGAQAYYARGHNLMPWSGNGLWYPINSQNGNDGTTNRPYLTPHPYADLSRLFRIL